MNSSCRNDYLLSGSKENHTKRNADIAKIVFCSIE